MNIRLHIAGILLIGAPIAWAQTANDFITQGRAYLAATNLAGANTSFSNAIVLSPTNMFANTFYAATRLLTWPSRPAGSNFLTRVGMPLAGRDMYHWTARLPEDTNGVPLAPTGVNASEATALLRTNLLAELIAAGANLAQVGSSNFTLSLTAAETQIAAVTVDYGDLQMIRAALYAAEYAIYTLNAQNLDVQLSSLGSLYTNGLLTASQVLARYPQLFTFATTNDLQSACTAFTNAVNAYFAASEFIRSRPTNVVRLFNYDAALAQKEGDFRLVLQDLKNSLLLGPQMLALNPNVTVDMGSQFNEPASWRSLLPRFQGNAVALGSLPDLSFGGLADGLSEGDVESFLGKWMTMMPVGSAPAKSASNTLSLTFTTLAGHYYVLQGSTNLVNWDMLASFTATDSTSTLFDSQIAGVTRRFYRLRDDAGFMTFSGQVFDQQTGLPIAGAQVFSLWDGTNTRTDANGRFYLRTTLPASQNVGYLQISAPGYNTLNNYYSGNGLVSGLSISLVRPPGNDNFVNRFVVSGSTVSTNGNNAGATWESGEPPDANGSYGNKSVWFSWTAPTTGAYMVSVSTSTVYYPIVALYTGTQLSALTTVADVVGSSYYAAYTLSAVAGQIYQIEIDDYSGIGGAYTLSIGP